MLFFLLLCVSFFFRFIQDINLLSQHKKSAYFDHEIDSPDIMVDQPQWSALVKRCETLGLVASFEAARDITHIDLRPLLSRSIRDQLESHGYVLPPNPPQHVYTDDIFDEPFRILQAKLKSPYFYFNPHPTLNASTFSLSTLIQTSKKPGNPYPGGTDIYIAVGMCSWHSEFAMIKLTIHFQFLLSAIYVVLLPMRFLPPKVPIALI